MARMDPRPLDGRDTPGRGSSLCPTDTGHRAWLLAKHLESQKRQLSSFFTFHYYHQYEASRVVEKEAGRNEQARSSETNAVESPVVTLFPSRPAIPQGKLRTSGCLGYSCDGGTRRCGSGIGLGSCGGSHGMGTNPRRKRLGSWEWSPSSGPEPSQGSGPCKRHTVPSRVEFGPSSSNNDVFWSQLIKGTKEPKLSCSSRDGHADWNSSSRLQSRAVKVLSATSVNLN